MELRTEEKLTVDNTLQGTYMLHVHIGQDMYFKACEYKMMSRRTVGVGPLKI